MGSSPGIVTATSEIEYFWSPLDCGERNGEIIGYTYSFRRRFINPFINPGPPLDMEYNNVFINDTAADYLTQVTFRNLAPNVEYTLRIAANNGIGVGPEHTMNAKTPTGRKFFGNILIRSPF